jgi:hypothetical protein
VRPEEALAEILGAERAAGLAVVREELLAESHGRTMDPLVAAEGALPELLAELL